MEQSSEREREREREREGQVGRGWMCQKNVLLALISGAFAANMSGSKFQTFARILRMHIDVYTLGVHIYIRTFFIRAQCLSVYM